MNKLKLAILLAVFVALIQGVRAFNNSAEEFAQETAFRQLAIECAVQPDGPGYGRVLFERSRGSDVLQISIQLLVEVPTSEIRKIWIR